MGRKKIICADVLFGLSPLQFRPIKRKPKGSPPPPPPEVNEARTVFFFFFGEAIEAQRMDEWPETAEVPCSFWLNTKVSCGL